MSKEMWYEQILDANTEHVATTTARSLVDDAFPVRKGPQYWDADLDIYRSDRVGSTRFDVVLHHEPLQAAPLRFLLREVAPNKRKTSPDGILGDWVLANHDIRATENDEEPGRLLRIHRRFGEAWQEFIRSSHIFIDVLKNGSEDCKSENTIAIRPHIAWQIAEDGQRSFLFERASKWNMGDNIDHEQIDGVLGVIAVAYFSPKIRKKWPEYIQKQFMGPAQIPLLSLIKSDELLESPFVKKVESLT